MGERLSSIEIHRHLVDVYGDGIMIAQHVRMVERTSTMVFRRPAVHIEVCCERSTSN